MQHATCKYTRGGTPHPIPSRWWNAKQRHGWLTCGRCPSLIHQRTRHIDGHPQSAVACASFQTKRTLPRSTARLQNQLRWRTCRNAVPRPFSSAISGLLSSILREAKDVSKSSRVCPRAYVCRSHHDQTTLFSVHTSSD